MMKIITKNNSAIKAGSIIRTNQLIGKDSEYLMIVDNRYGMYDLLDLKKGVIQDHEYTLPELTEYLWNNPFNRIYNSDEIKLILGDRNA